MQEVSGKRALSGESRYNKGFEGVYDQLPKGDWSMPVRDAVVQQVECQDPKDVLLLKTMFPEYIKEDTSVFRLERGKRITRIGNVESVAGNTGAYRTNTGDISDRVGEGVIGISDADIIEENDAQADIVTKYVFGPAKYHAILASRKELGLSIDYFTRNGQKGERQDFRYRHRQKEGVAGVWTSKKYVSEAVDALHEYDLCLKSNSVGDLKKVVAIARKYFTKEAQSEAQHKIAKRSYELLVKRGDLKSLSAVSMIADRYLQGKEATAAHNYVEFCRRKEAVRLVGAAKKGKLDHDTGRHVYAQLVRMDDPALVSHAVDIARIYISEKIAAKTAVFRDNLIELKRKREGSGVRRKAEGSGVTHLPKQIPDLMLYPKQPPRPILRAYGASAA
jgi:hypothetical protein